MIADQKNSIGFITFNWISITDIGLVSITFYRQNMMEYILIIQESLSYKNLQRVLL